MRCNKILGILLILIFLIVFFSCFYLYFMDFLELKENNEEIESLIENATIESNIVEENENTSENTTTDNFKVNWERLKNINEDIIGWIKIEGTKINYPILRDSNDLYYLRRSYNKKYNRNGSIFALDTKLFKNSETVIYGHNMRNGAMFSALSKYLDKEFLYSHININFYTPEGDFKGEIFSVYSINVNEELDNIKSLDYKEKIAYYKKSSKYMIESTDEINKIVKLSTCSYLNTKVTNTEERYYIIANLVQVH